MGGLTHLADGLKPHGSIHFLDMKKVLAALVLGVSTVSGWALTCYTMLDAKEAVVYRSTTVPIDLSRSISAEMREKYPGFYFIFTTDGRDCHETNRLSVANTAPPENAQPIEVANQVHQTDVPSKKPRLNSNDNLPVVVSTDAVSIDSDYPSPLSVYSPDKRVSVRSYIRKNGTVVVAHSRSSRRR